MKNTRVREDKLFGSIEILGVRVSAVNLSLASQAISHWIDQNIKTYVCIAPVATLVECQKDARYRAVVNNAGMVTPDGMPVVWLGKLGGNKVIARTYGPDLVLSFCALSQEKGYKHFFYGGTPEANRLLEVRLKERFPRLTVIGKYSPAFRELSDREDAEIVELINRLRPDVLWVGLGSPRQDFWMAEHRDRISAPVMIGVGAAFDFLSGMKRQAPKWIQSIGMEWFFRLCCEPRRLWKRYLIGNSQFFFYLMINSFRKHEI